MLFYFCILFVNSCTCILYFYCLSFGKDFYCLDNLEDAWIGASSNLLTYHLIDTFYAPQIVSDLSSFEYDHLN